MDSLKPVVKMLHRAQADVVLEQSAQVTGTVRDRPRVNLNVPMDVRAVLYLPDTFALDNRP